MGSIPKVVIALIAASLLFGGWLIYKNVPKSQVAQQTKQVIQEKVLSKEDLLRQRATEYNDAYSYKDYAKSYTFLPPDDQKLITKDDYIKRLEDDDKEASPYTLKDIKIDSIEIEGDTGTVRLTFISCPLGVCIPEGDKDSNIQKTKDSSRWLYINGQWYRPAISDNKDFYGIK